MRDPFFNDVPEAEQEWQASQDALLCEAPPPQPPDRPDHPDRWREALEDPDVWGPWDVIHDEAAIRALLPLCTYGLREGHRQ